MNFYRSLQKQVFMKGDYSIIPIRMEDRYAILKWRNEQIYHLRQNELLTREKQDIYFAEVVSQLFEQQSPGQILFSYLKGERCIGYGGLVHINWIDKNAEISFLMDTALEKDYFHYHWTNFLGLIEEVAFRELRLHKIFTYAYDIRTELFDVLIAAGYMEDARLKGHCCFNREFIDVVIHSKIEPTVILRLITQEDINITFKWANDPFVRQFSYNQEKVNLAEHRKWLKSQLNSGQCEYFILEYDAKPAGSIRFDLDERCASAKISYLLDSQFTGMGLGTRLLQLGEEKLRERCPRVHKVWGQVFESNFPSIRIFRKLGYIEVSKIETVYTFEKEFI